MEQTKKILVVVLVFVLSIIICVVDEFYSCIGALHMNTSIFQKKSVSSFFHMDMLTAEL